MQKPGEKELGLRAMRNTRLEEAHAMMVADGAPPSLLRHPTNGGASPSKAPEPVKADQITMRTMVAAVDAPKKIVEKMTPDDEDRSIRREADSRWRNWTATAKELSRPKLTTFVKKVREERKATKPVTPKATAMPAATSKETTVKTSTKKATKTSPKKPAAKKASPKKPNANARTPVKGARPDGLREGSKQAEMLDLALKPEGATEAAICKKLGWKKCRVTLKRVCERVGASIESKKNAVGETVFFATMKKV